MVPVKNPTSENYWEIFFKVGKLVQKMGEGKSVRNFHLVSNFGD